MMETAGQGELGLLPTPSPSTQLLKWRCHSETNTSECNSKTENSRYLPKDSNFTCNRAWRRSSLTVLSGTVQVVVKRNGKKKREFHWRNRLNCRPASLPQKHRKTYGGGASLKSEQISSTDFSKFPFGGAQIWIHVWSNLCPKTLKTMKQSANN